MRFFGLLMKRLAVAAADGPLAGISLLPAAGAAEGTMGPGFVTLSAALCPGIPALASSAGPSEGIFGEDTGMLAGVEVLCRPSAYSMYLQRTSLGRSTRIFRQHISIRLGTEAALGETHSSAARASSAASCPTVASPPWMCLPKCFSVRSRRP